MPEQIHARVEACYQQAEAFFKQRFARPEISFKLRGQKAGVAHLTENKLRFNLQLYRANQEDFLRQTVPHEVAHMVAHQLFGPRIQPHGEEWQLIMRGVYELPGLDDCDTASLSHWILTEARKVLPQVDRVDLYETRGSGAIALLGHEGPALPI